MKTRSFFLLFIGGAMFLGSCRGGGGGGWLGLAFLHHQNRRSIPTPTTAAIVNWKDDYSTTFSPSRKAARTLLRSISTKKTSSGSTNSESDASSPSSSPMSSGMEQDSDTLLHLPEFTSKEEYIQYLSLHAALPQGFQCGSASGKFVAVEAPMLGPLNIKATVVYLNEPTRNWAACFTKNKVSLPCLVS